MPGMADPRFDKAVIAMCSHDEGGALGIRLGRILPRIGFHDLLAQLDIEAGQAPNAPIHVGGPVEPQRGFILHSLDWGGQETIDVAGLWGLTATLDILRAIAEGRGPARWVAALGYAGWAPGQLEDELVGDGWFNAPATDHLLFGTDVGNRWAASFASAGIDARLLAAGTGTA